MIRLYAHDGTSSSDLWQEGAVIALPSEAARHAQVRRVQPGDVVLLKASRSTRLERVGEVIRSGTGAGARLNPLAGQMN